MDKEWITTSEAAEILDMSIDSVRALGREGRATMRRVPHVAPQRHRQSEFLRSDIIAISESRARIAAMHAAARDAAASAVLADDDVLTTGEAGMIAGHGGIVIASFVRGGLIRATRTSGGHIRIRYADLRKFMEEEGNG